MLTVDQSYPALDPGVIALGQRHFIRPNGFGGYLWWHDCPAVEHVPWGWFGQGQTERSGHVVRNFATDLVTVEGSLICTDCQDHGFIRDSRWVPA
jgi:hypothetical protein